MKKILALALYGEIAASTRYRMSQYVDYLAEAGYQLDIQPLLTDSYLQKRFANETLPVFNIAFSVFRRIYQLVRSNQYDAIWVYGELIPFCPSIFEKWLLRLPYLYDLDDAFYLKYKGRLAKPLSYLLEHKIEDCFTNATLVTVGNDTLQEYASQFNGNVHYLPTVVDLGRYTCRVKEPDDSCLAIGWLGSPSTVRYLEPLVPVLQKLATQCPLKLIVVGGAAPEIDGVIVEEHNWSESTELEHIKSFHIGIMPLTDDAWARGKCGFKLIQYMACGVPVVAEAVGANMRVVTSECGYLVHSPEEWYEALLSLMKNKTLRERMAAAGRRRIEQEYSLQTCAVTLVNAFNQLTASQGKSSCAE